jgi:Tfp pilus assembly protein FimT
MISGEKGIGIITTIVIIAISAIIAFGAGMTTIQMMRSSERNIGLTETVQQAHSLGRWFTRDAMASSNISPGDDAETGEEELATLYWGDWESGEYYYIRYIWLDDVEPLKKITRTEIQYDKEGGVADSIENLVACGIYTANLTQQGDTWTLTVEARSGEKSSIQTYETAQRLD